MVERALCLYQQQGTTDIFRSHRIEGRCATTRIKQIYAGKAEHVASRRNTCNLEDHLDRSLA
eukprot:14772083-Heterocapsa_arctica.AAC.1